MSKKKFDEHGCIFLILIGICTSFIHYVSEGQFYEEGVPIVASLVIGFLFSYFPGFGVMYWFYVASDFFKEDEKKTIFTYIGLILAISYCILLVVSIVEFLD